MQAKISPTRLPARIGQSAWVTALKLALILVFLFWLVPAWIRAILDSLLRFYYIDWVIIETLISCVVAAAACFTVLMFFYKTLKVDLVNETLSRGTRTVRIQHIQKIEIMPWLGLVRLRITAPEFVHNLWLDSRIMGRLKRNDIELLQQIASKAAGLTQPKWLRSLPDITHLEKSKKSNSDANEQINRIFGLAGFEPITLSQAALNDFLVRCQQLVADGKKRLRFPRLAVPSAKDKARRKALRKTAKATRSVLYGKIGVKKRYLATRHWLLQVYPQLPSSKTKLVLMLGLGVVLLGILWLFLVLSGFNPFRFHLDGSSAVLGYKIIFVPPGLLISWLGLKIVGLTAAYEQRELRNYTAAELHRQVSSLRENKQAEKLKIEVELNDPTSLDFFLAAPKTPSSISTVSQDARIPIPHQAAAILWEGFAIENWVRSLRLLLGASALLAGLYFWLFAALLPGLITLVLLLPLLINLIGLLFAAAIMLRRFANRYYLACSAELKWLTNNPLLF